MRPRRRDVLRLAPGGWLGYWGQGHPAVLVRFEDRDGRLEPVELHLPPGTEPLDAARLRAVPLGRITAWANAPDVAADLRSHMAERQPAPGDDDFFKMYGRGIAARLGRIPDPPYGDDFYRRVAAAYSALARQLSRPAAELAEANDLPVTTVHSWIKQARRRGFLPPGRAGKAG